MRRLAAVFFVLVVALVSGVADAQEGPVSVRASLDRGVMAIGDQALLTVTVDLAAGHDLEDPGVPRAIGDLEVVEILTVLQSRTPNGASRFQLRYLVTAWELGLHSIPVIEVGYRGPSGETGDALSQGPIPVMVASVIVPGEDASDIKPLKPPLPVPGAENELLTRWLPFGAVAALIVVAAFLALRIRSRGGLLVGSLHGPARRELDELERVAELHLVERGKVAEQYELMNASLRRFVRDRYSLNAEARTARELRRELERAGLDRGRAEIVCEVLADAESIRYQGRPVSSARAQKSLRDVLELMRRSAATEEYELAGGGATA